MAASIGVYIGFWDTNFTLIVDYNENNSKKYDNTLIEVSPKYDLLRDSVSGDDFHHALLSIEVKKIPIDFLSNILGGAILVNNIPVQNFLFEQSGENENIRYYFKEFMGKDIHHENTWSSCLDKLCDINIQFYNNRFDLTGKYKSLTVELYSANDSISLSKFNPIMPSQEDAKKKIYPLTKTFIDKDNLVLDFIPIHQKDATIIIQFNDDNGRSDIFFSDLSKINIIDKKSNTHRVSVKFDGELKYAAALIYDDLNKVENKHVIINKQEY
jgi:hypothetical protein